MSKKKFSAEIRKLPLSKVEQGSLVLIEKLYRRVIKLYSCAYPFMVSFVINGTKARDLSDKAITSIQNTWWIRVSSVVSLHAKNKDGDILLITNLQIKLSPLSLTSIS